MRSAANARPPAVRRHLASHPNDWAMQLGPIPAVSSVNGITSAFDSHRNEEFTDQI